MKVAVSYKDGEIFEHFGYAETFAIYDYAGADVDNCVKTLVESGHLHGHKQMAEFMKSLGVDAVISGNMGGEAKAQLLSFGIVPIAGYCGDADTAADLLVTGQLPIIESGGACSGSCSGCGGCGGCGGSCGHDEEDSRGCEDCCS